MDYFLFLNILITKSDKDIRIPLAAKYSYIQHVNNHLSDGLHFNTKSNPFSFLFIEIKNSLLNFCDSQ